jgi:hypothetical protein
MAVLVAVFLRLRKADFIGELMAKRRANSKLVCRADYMEGMEKLPVAIAITDESLFYENEDLQASLEWAHVEEVEYDEETATGHQVNGRVLRLRSHGHCFEFVVDEAMAKQLQSVVTPRHYDESRQAAS